MILNQIRGAVEFASHVPRYREIIGILWKYGFADVLKLMALQKFLNISEAPSVHTEGVLSEPLPVRVRMALEELGPTFVKFGQIVSSRRDLVTDEFYEELCKLQANVPPFPAREARKIIEEETGLRLPQIFRVFEDTPVGSASIAQVHRAELLDGSVVAVKVQRPDITERIERDLAILQDLAAFIERHSPDLSSLNPVGVVTEFSETLLKELDFTNEAVNAERFAKEFDGNPWIKVPAIFREYSSARVLVMDFLEGCSPDDVDQLVESGIDPKELAKHITELLFEQIFDHGFFHGDPHPGNMKIQGGGVTALLDYGMMGTFSPAFRSSIAHLIAGLAEKNLAVVQRSILAMSEEGYTPQPMRMLADVEAFAETHLNRPLRDIRLGDTLNRLLDMLRNNRLRMKGSFYLGVKALTQVEAIGRALDPDMNFILLGEPFASKLIRGKYEPTRIFGVLKGLVSEGIDFLEDFPHDFRNVYQQIKSGRVNIPLEHKIDPKGFEPLRRTLDMIANRLANAILTASVLICSGILVLSGIPPKLGGIPLLGLIGLIFGAVMCVRLVLSIWRHGGL
ncbi:MAG: AarF/ABC1/UbiB kinase family protein [Terrimicrobiaceae bacterium]